jgi:hypothetical protein
LASKLSSLALLKMRDIKEIILECVYKLLMSLYLRLFSPESSSLCLGNIAFNIAQTKRGALRGK